MARLCVWLLLFVLTACNTSTSNGGDATPPPPSPPGAPVSLTAIDGDASVQLSWIAPAGAKSFRVLRAATADGPYGLRGTTESPRFEDTAPNGVASFYEVEATSEAGNGPATAPVRIVPYPVCLTTDDKRVVVIRQGHDHGPPLRQFGDLTGIGFSGGVAVDPVRDEILVGSEIPSPLRASATFDRSASGNVAPKRRLSALARAFAVDASAGRILVVPPSGDAIETYDASTNGTAAPLHTVRGAFTGLDGTRTILVDAAHGELVALTVASADPANPIASLNTYSLAEVESPAVLPDLAPLRVISGPAASLRFATGAAAIDEVHGEIAVVLQPNPSGATVAIFDRLDQGSVVVPKLEIPVDTFQPGGIAVDSAHDEIWVAGLFHDDADPNAVNPRIAVFSRTAVGQAAPLRVLSGPSTELFFPGGLAVDESAGEIMVIDDGRLLVFDTAASGDAPPKRILSGRSSGLLTPAGIVADRLHRELIVANRRGSVSMYSRDSAGAVTPVRSFGIGIGFFVEHVHYDPGEDEIFVPSIDNTVRVYPRTSSNPQAVQPRILPGVAQPSGITGVGSEIALADAQTVITRDGRTGSIIRRIISTLTDGQIFAMTADPRKDELVVLWHSSVYPRGALRIFGRRDNGEVVPRRVITSSSFLFLGPIAVNDVTGEIWAVGFSQTGRQGIAVFSATAALDAEPARIIDAVDIGIASVQGMAFCP